MVDKKTPDLGNNSDELIDAVPEETRIPMPEDSDQDVAPAEESAEVTPDAERDTPEENTFADPVVAAPVDAPRKNGSVLGGVGFVILAAGIGAIGYLGFQQNQRINSAISDLTETILKVQADANDAIARIGLIEGLAGTSEEALAQSRSAMVRTQALADQQGKTDAMLGRLREEIDSATGLLRAVDDRLTAIETRPPVEGGASKEAIAAYDRALESARAALEEQRLKIEAAAGLASEQIEAAESKASELEASARASANAALVRAALTRIDAALASGGGFAGALQEIGNVGSIDLPDALVAAADSGVPTLSDLQSSFPPAARAALDASIRATVGEGVGDRLGAFFRTQLGARSLAPRQGDDPDAILSRAEAALRDGQLETVLAEIATLPEAGQVELADWASTAQFRIETLAAVRVLAQGVMGN